MESAEPFLRAGFVTSSPPCRWATESHHDGARCRRRGVGRTTRSFTQRGYRMSTHVVRKAETGEVAVVTPVQVVTDAGSHETSLAEMNPVLDYIAQHAPEDSELQGFVEDGGTEDAP